MRNISTAVFEKQRRALELRNLGADYDRIAEELGYADKSGAWRAVQAALDRAVIEPALQQRIIQNDRLDRLLRACLAAFDAGELDQVRNILAIEKRRADLFGLDAAKGVELTGAGGGAIRTDVGEMLLQRLLALAENDEEPTPLSQAIETTEGRLAGIEAALDGYEDEQS